MSAQPGTVGVRYPLHELEALIDWPSKAEMAATVGTSETAVAQWRVRGLSHRQADELAILYGHHPAVVWPGWLAYEHVPSSPLVDRRPARKRPTIHGAIGSPAELATRSSMERAGRSYVTA